MTQENEVTRYDWLTLFREGPQGFMRSCFEKMNDETCRITAAGVKRNFPLWTSWQRTVWWNFQQKNIEIYPRRKENQREEKQKSFSNFGVIMIVQNSVHTSQRIANCSLYFIF
jgi:hypothetical protein